MMQIEGLIYSRSDMIPKTLFELHKDDNLLQTFEAIHNYIYANDGLSPQQTLEEIVKILFLKVADENNKTNLFSITANELNEINRGNDSGKFSSRFSCLFTQTRETFKEVFDTDEKIKLSQSALGFAVDKLQNVSLTDSSKDAAGLAFQKFLASRDKEGRGQFFTPEPVINFCVEIIQPQPNEKIIDPACGSGGFLFSALRYMQRNFPAIEPDQIISQSLFGIDINKSIAKIARMKMLLETNVRVNIFCANSLENAEDLSSFDIVLANPPFGTVGKITNTSLLSRFALGHKWIKHGEQFHQTKQLLKGQVTEILFLERCLSLLREGGRMGIILPNGNFENSSLEYLRYYIKQKAKVLAVVNLPPETFIPYGTGVKTSLLFLEKDSVNQKKQYKVFFSKIKKLGYQGNKNGTPTYKKDNFGNLLRDAQNKPVIDEDFSEVIEDYKSFQNDKLTATENSFSVAFNEVNGRFDYDFYAPENRKLIESLESKHAVKLSSIAEIVRVKSKKLSQNDLVVEYVELSDINTHSFEIINSTSYAVHDLPSRASYEIETGDIITAVAGNSVGSKKHATALVTEEYDGCICTNGFRVLRNFKVDPHYLLFFFKSDAFLQQMLMYRTGAAIPSISDTDFANTLIYLPNEKAIKEISQRVKRAFELRIESRKELESIKLEML
jgi:type I restriction enzyme M protein